MKTKVIIAVVVLVLVSTAFLVFRPYSSAEKNSATVYYQSYSQLQASIGQYVGMLENYHSTEDDVYLENAMVRLDNIRDNINIFTIVDNINFRNTYVNEKVVQTDLITERYLQDLKTHYSNSSSVLEQYLEDKRIGDTSFEDFLHFNQLIFNGLTTEELGYHTDTKEYRVVLDENKTDLLDEGMSGLSGIVENIAAP
jgi:hypothetical protein